MSRRPLNASISASLRQTKDATWAIYVRTRSDRPPEVRGTCFAVRSDGLFLTARHVVVDKMGDVLAIEGLLQPAPQDEPQSGALRVAEDIKVVAEWPDRDIALLGVDASRNSEKAWWSGGFPAIPIADEASSEGDPVYSYGFPLARDVHVVDYGIAAIAWPAVSPRLVSAILAGIDYIVGGDPSHARPHILVADKAFDYGQSGAPLVATGTGKAIGVVLEFEPTAIDQGDGRELWLPSTFGLASSLEGLHPAILAHGVQN